eukprot:1327827-Pyramimonas_sp.AAC.1
MGPRTVRGEGRAEIGGGTRPNPAFGGAPYGATKRVRVCRNGRGGACEPCRWGLRWSFLWGRETCERCVEVDGENGDDNGDEDNDDGGDGDDGDDDGGHENEDDDYDGDENDDAADDDDGDDSVDYDNDDGDDPLVPLWSGR